MRSVGQYISRRICTSTFYCPLTALNCRRWAIYRGVALAKVLGKALGARVTVVTVTTPFHVMSGSPAMATETAEQYRKRVKAAAEHYLDSAKKIADAAGVRCDAAHIEHERPYQAIIETAKNQGCDAIHMTSHGRHGISAIVLGSETLKVLTHSAIPVIVCRLPRASIADLLTAS